jgi:hypothetical protein
MTVPRVKETKTTRERIQYLKQSRLPPNERKKKTPYETYSTKESELKMRRSWDLRVINTSLGLNMFVYTKADMYIREE